jgi:hypothetical protein
MLSIRGTPPAYGHWLNTSPPNERGYRIVLYSALPESD